MHIIYPVKGRDPVRSRVVYIVSDHCSCLGQTLHEITRAPFIDPATPTARHPSSHSPFLLFFLFLSLWSMQNSHAHKSLYTSTRSAKKRKKNCKEGKKGGKTMAPIVLEPGDCSHKTHWHQNQPPLAPSSSSFCCCCCCFCLSLVTPPPENTKETKFFYFFSFVHSRCVSQPLWTPNVMMYVRFHEGKRDNKLEILFGIQSSLNWWLSEDNLRV